MPRLLVPGLRYQSELVEDSKPEIPVQPPPSCTATCPFWMPGDAIHAPMLLPTEDMQSYGCRAKKGFPPTTAPTNQAILSLTSFKRFGM